MSGRRWDAWPGHDLSLIRAEVLGASPAAGSLMPTNRDMTGTATSADVIVGHSTTVSICHSATTRLSPYRRNIDAALTGMDALWVLDRPTSLFWRDHLVRAHGAGREQARGSRCGGSVPVYRLCQCPTPRRFCSAQEVCSQEPAPVSTWTGRRSAPGSATGRALGASNSVPVDVVLLCGRQGGSALWSRHVSE